MTEFPDANEFLMGGGIPSISFKNKPFGTTYKGKVVREPEVQQQTDFDSGKPLFWDDGKPKLQAKIVIQTDERDPKIQDDDGLRALYAKGNLQKAVAAGVRAAGARRVEVGAELSVTLTGEGEAKGKLNPPKLYSATYEPPNPLAMAADPVGAQAGAAGDQPPTGVDPAAWAALSGEQKARLRAAMSASQPPLDELPY